MSRILTLMLVTFAFGCKDSTKPLDPWVGTWSLRTIDGMALPADTTVDSVATLVVFRTLELYSNGEGIWTDSSFSSGMGWDAGAGSPWNRMSNTSGWGLVNWTAVADTLKVVRVFGSTTGYVVPMKTFYKQADGSLLKTDESRREVYRR